MFLLVEHDLLKILQWFLLALLLGILLTRNLFFHPYRAHHWNKISIGCINVGDTSWIQFVLMTKLKCWWPIWYVGADFYITKGYCTKKVTNITVNHRFIPSGKIHRLHRCWWRMLESLQWRPNEVTIFECWWQVMSPTSRVRHQQQISVTNITFWRIMMLVTDVSPSRSG